MIERRQKALFLSAILLEFKPEVDVEIGLVRLVRISKRGSQRSQEFQVIEIAHFHTHFRRMVEKIVKVVPILVSP